MWRRLSWALLAIFLLAAIALAVLLLAGRNGAPITASAQTTRLTAYQGPQDYVAAVNSAYGKDVTPDNNAAVLLFQAVGPKKVAPATRAELFKLLGMPNLPDDGPYLVSFDTFVKRWEVDHAEAAQKLLGDLNADRAAKSKAAADRLAAAKRDLWEHDDEAVPPNGATRDDKVDLVRQLEENPDLRLEPLSLLDLANEQFDKAVATPWSADEFPIVADWLHANDAPLKLVVEASRRPKYFEPWVSIPGQPMISGILFPLPEGTHEAAQALAARAMLRAQKSQNDEAWQDLLVCHRLARLIGQGPAMVNSFVEAGVEAIAVQGDQALANQGALTADQAWRYLAELAGLPLLSPISSKIDLAERFLCLDSMVQFANGGNLGGAMTAAGKKPAGLGILKQGFQNLVIDWDESLRTVNRWYDRLVAASNLPSARQRTREMNALKDEIEATVIDFNASRLKLLWAGRAGRGEQSANIFLALLTPAVAMVSEAMDRVGTTRQITEVVFALAAYRADQGKYPDKLADLTPQYVKALPKDLFGEADLIYRLQDDGGYLLYSVGPNGLDNGGRDRASAAIDEDERQLDDLIVRAPGKKP
jgi:hypothetical protein